MNKGIIKNIYNRIVSIGKSYGSMKEVCESMQRKSLMKFREKTLLKSVNNHFSKVKRENNGYYK